SDLTAPTVSNQTFCSSRNATLADLVITGTNIKWYDASTGGNVLLATTPLVNGTTYYASHTLNNCESTRSAVQVTITPTTSLSTTQLDFCSGVKIEDVELEGFSPADLRWYDDATTTTAIASSQDLQTGTYYVSTYSGNCESVRQPIQVDVAAPVASPTGSTHQKFLF